MRLLILAVLVLLFFLLLPWYRQYVVQQNWIRCEHIRSLVFARYEVQAEGQQDLSPEERLDILEQCFEEWIPGSEIQEGEDCSFSVPNKCPSGGVITISVSEDGVVSLTCSVPTHYYFVYEHNP